MRQAKPHILWWTPSIGKPNWRYLVSGNIALDDAAERFCRRLNQGLGFA
jgi:hypothetical protein